MPPRGYGPAAEDCTITWCRSARIRLTDAVINDALLTVTGFQRPSPADNLPILAAV